jgi:hypothetical protein
MELSEDGSFDMPAGLPGDSLAQTIDIQFGGRVNSYVDSGHLERQGDHQVGFCVDGEDVMARHCPNPDCAGLARDGVVAEYVDAISVCADCGTRLIRGRAERDPDLGLEYNDLRTVFVAGSVVQGHLVAAAIEAEGIPVYIKGEMLQGAIGELSPEVSRVEVQVPIDRFDRAREISDRFEGAVR